MTDTNFLGNGQYVGYLQNVQNNNNYRFMMDDQRLHILQQKITEILEGVEPDGRPIVVPLDTIRSVVYQCYQAYIPDIGNIYTTFIQTDETLKRNDVSDIYDQAVNIITSYIKTYYMHEENARKLTIWNSVLGDYNKAGVRAYQPIKVNNRRPSTLQINMRY